MKLYETWIRRWNYSDNDYDNIYVWIGVFSSYEKAESIGINALEKLLTDQIKVRRGKRGQYNDIYAEFDDVKYELCIDCVELDQRYDGIK